MKLKHLKKYVVLLLILATVQTVFGKIRLPSVLSDNMVLQQKSKVSIWGWTTAPSEKITIWGSWNNTKVTVEAYQGEWSVVIETPTSGGPYTLTVEGHEKIVIQNVLIGEVWVASGQSNMEWTPTHGLLNADEEVAKANYPNIRFFQVDKRISRHPQDDVPGKWVECSPETMKHFSSVAYFFARGIQDRLSFPVGLISSNWGGTPIETWIPEELIEESKALQKAAKKITKRAWWPSDPGLAFNAMIHPLLQFEIAGCIWYQGESNRENAASYYTSFPLLIKAWRERWDKAFPFYFAQIAPFDYKSKDPRDAALVRDAQLYTMLNVPKTGMAVTNDIGNLANIHPINKQEVGRRLALWALTKDYGVEGIEYTGPVYKSMEIKGKKALLSFDNVGGRLMKKGKNLTDFEIAGGDKVFYPAKAKIVDDRVVVSAAKVKDPVAVRFAFTNTAEPNLFNTEGLPASAFRTDAWTIDK